MLLPDTWIDPQAVLTPKPTLEGINRGVSAMHGFTVKTLKRAGNSNDVLIQFETDAYSDDHEHLVQTAMTYLGLV